VDLGSLKVVAGHDLVAFDVKVVQEDHFAAVLQLGVHGEALLIGCDV